MSVADLAPKNPISCEGYVFSKASRVQFDSGCETVIREPFLPSNIKKGRLVAVADYLGFTRVFKSSLLYQK